MAALNGNQRDDYLMIGAGMILLVYLIVNVLPAVASVFIAMAVSYFILFSSRKYNVLHITKPNFKLFDSALIVIASVFGWVGLNYFISAATGNVLNLSFSSIPDFFKSMSVLSGIPIISNELITRVITWGLSIPLYETLFFIGFCYWFYGNFSKINPSSKKLNIKTVWVFILVGATASMVHIYTRSLMGIPTRIDYALFVDMVFFSYSMLIGWWTGQMAEALALHGTVNTLSVIY